jgi:hypothetical protein
MVWHFSKVNSKSSSPSVVRAVVRAVDGGIGTARYCAGIEDEGLVEDIEADRGFSQETLLIIGTGNEAEELPPGMAEKSHSH